MNAPASSTAIRRSLDDVSAYWPLLPAEVAAALHLLLQAGDARARGRCLGALQTAVAPPAACLTDLILDRIPRSDVHPYLRRAAEVGPAATPTAVRGLMAVDLRRWQEIAADADARLGLAAAAAPADPVPATGDPLAVAAPAAAAAAARRAWVEAVRAGGDWGEHVDALGALVHVYGLGAEQGCVAFRFEADGHGARLVPIRDVAAFDLDWLEGNRERLAVVEDNTRNLLDGYRALNTLIWGPRGCGKSSLIRGLLTRYARQGLRGIEVPARSYARLGELYDLVRHRRERFLGILDNVSLERTDLASRALSTALDGGLEEMPANLVFYATSNFKDLVDRGGERPQGPPAMQSDDAPAALRHTSDSASTVRRGYDPQGFQRLDERRALDDRFALKVFIDMPTKSEYDRLVLAYARRVGIDTEAEQLLADFQVWRLRHNHDLVGGRTARDFVLARYPGHARRSTAEGEAGAQRR